MTEKETCYLCGRSTVHVHYSRWHEISLKCGLLLFLVAEGISFGTGVVKGATQLYLDYSTIQTYTQVSNQIEEALVAYQYLNNFALLMELSTLILAIVAVVTLHSQKRNLHLAAVIGGPIAFVLGIITKWYYNSFVTAVMPNLVYSIDSSSLRTFMTTQQRFEEAYGFWGAPANSLNAVFSWISLALLVGAILLCRVVYSATPQQPQAIIEPPAATAKTSSVAGDKPKFCRYCGGKIPRTSKFCEECGKNLI